MRSVGISDFLEWLNLPLIPIQVAACQSLPSALQEQMQAEEDELDLLEDMSEVLQASAFGGEGPRNFRG